MESLVARKVGSHFKAPDQSLGDLDAAVAARLIAAAADIALIVDATGTIQDVSFGNEDLAQEGFADWTGKAWIDTVTAESRPKIEALLKDDSSSDGPRWRQVNHPTSSGPDVPVLYSVVQMGSGGRVVAVGRDLRAIASLQQRLVNAQQSMEREYSRLRHAETRYRLLFQIASEAVLIVEADGQRVVEANPAAGQLLGVPEKKLAGRGFLALFDPSSGVEAQSMLASVRSGGRVDDVQLTLAGGDREFLVSASLFRQENASHYLVRLSPRSGGDSAQVVPRTKSKLLKVVENLPDGFVVTSPDLAILTANVAFLDLVQLATEEQVRGQPLERWLGRPGVDMNILVANLREHGSVRHFSTILRGEYAVTEEVMISAVSVLNGEQPCFGFTIRNAGRRPTTETRFGRELPRSVEQLTELVGRVSLKDLVRETTDLIERLSIEAALELTGDNRASAAEVLGLSRQSLYVKMRRFGLGDLDQEPEN